MADATLRIGFIGNKAAGKTTLHTIWYLHPAPPEGMPPTNLILIFNDEPTRTRLSECATDLEINRSTNATALGPSDLLRWQMRLDDRKIAVTSRDYSGELIERASDKIASGQFQAVIDEVWGHITGCDAVFLLLDVTTPQTNQLNVTYELIDRLRERNARGLDRRPVALLWMKVDRVIAIAPDQDENMRRITDYTRRRPVFGSIRRLLDELSAGDSSLLKEFAVSAFGGYQDDEVRRGLSPPFDYIEPSGVFHPLGWAASRAADLAADHWGAKFRRGQASGGRLSGWRMDPPSSRCRSAHALYDQELPLGQVERQDLLEAITNEKKHISRGASRWWVRRSATGVATLLLMSLAVFWYLRIEAFRRYNSVVADTKACADDRSASERIVIAEGFLGSFWAQKCFSEILPGSP